MCSRFDGHVKTLFPFLLLFNVFAYRRCLLCSALGDLTSWMDGFDIGDASEKKKRVFVGSIFEGD